MSILKAKVSFYSHRYPKGKINHGDWAIMLGNIVDVIEGEAIANGREQFIFKGIVPEIEWNSTYTICAERIEDPQWGVQYDLLGPPVMQVNLEDPNEQNLFLSYILTDVQIKNMYQTLENPFEAIRDENFDLLTSVKGIGEFKASKIIQKYKATIDYSNAYIYLSQYNLTENTIKKLIDVYQNPDILVDKIQTNPYILADEVEGIGWFRADSIALASGIEPLSKYRIQAFIKYFLTQQANKGHSWVEPLEIMEALWSNIDDNLSREHTKPAFDELYENKEILWDDEKTFVSLTKYYYLEKNIAKDLIRVNNSKNEFDYSNWELIVEKIQNEQGWEYTAEQKKGVQTVLENQVVVITGKAGVGKSTVANAMMKVFPDATKGLCALAGRASARLGETTGLNGETIHRFLKFNPKRGFGHNRSFPVEKDIILLDETSMVGGYLYYQLIQSIKNGSKLIMLGDDGQLESIGTLNVFRDIMDSGVIPVVRLTEIHRQSAKSAIITESLKVSNGEQLYSKKWTGTEIRGELQDLKLHIYDEKEFTPFAIMENFKEKFEKYNGNIMDIQVIVPTKFKGDASIHEMNVTIQDFYNNKNFVNKTTIKRTKNKIDYSYELRVGDKIINKKNNQTTVNEDGENTPIWNGNLGIIEEINEIRGLMIINFQSQGRVIVKKKFWDAIELGYAITVHSMQGSQVKSVIIGIDFSAYSLLTRELVYTAMTRAIEDCVLCAESNALRFAIETSKVPEKRTFLHKFLKDMQDEYNSEHKTTIF